MALRADASFPHSRSLTLNLCATKQALRSISLVQIQSGDCQLVYWETGCFPHVRDLWCGSDSKVPGNLAAPPTLSHTIETRRQCKHTGRVIDLRHGTRQLRCKLKSQHQSHQYRLRLHVAERIGEAANPGPTSCVTFAVTNPTTIYRKSSLATDLGVDTLILSENAATVPVQNLEAAAFRQQGYTTVWGHPMLPHRQSDRDAGNDSHKGVAAGVSIHSLHRIRASNLRDTSDWFEAGRCQHAFIQFPKHEFQILNLYGYPSCKPKARLNTNKLIAHALDRAATNTFPMILCGDLNHHPDDLDSLRPLWEHGFQTAEQIYFRLYGQQLPPTFQEATRNDVAIFSPTIVPFVTRVWVDDQHLVAGHNPLCFEFTLPDTSLHRQQWRLPKTWISFQPKPDLIAKHFQVPDFSNQDHPLQVWSTAVEKAVHSAIQEESSKDPAQETIGLPKSHRGRCQPFKITKTPLPRTVKPAWEDHYTPNIDQAPIRIKQLTKQMRRVQSLKRRLVKWETDSSLDQQYWDQLWQEWMCIVRSKGLPGGFLAWISNIPELEQLPMHLPTSEYIHLLEQFLRHHVDREVAQQLHKQKQLSQLQRDADVKKFGRAGAFRSVKEQGMGLLGQITETKTCEVQTESIPMHGLLTLQLPQDAVLTDLTGLCLNGQPVEVVQWNPPELEVILQNADATYSPPFNLTYKHTTSQPYAITTHLDTFWRTHWDRDKNQPPAAWQDLEQMIDRLDPQDMIQDDFYDLQEWKSALRHLKAKSARGCCAWAPDELRTLPDECIAALILAFKTLGVGGMRKELMAARTVPVQKQQNADLASQTRPITVLSLLYRLWGRVTSQIILRKWGTYFPKAITGFLPHRSAVLPMYHLQHQLERARDPSQKTMSGLTLDICKCFNALPITPAKRLFACLGIPPDVIEFWYSSITQMSRVWQVHGQLFETGPQVTGVPEGDAFSVLVMLAYNYLWTKAIEMAPVQASAYADNWSYAVHDLTSHHDVLPVILQTVRSMCLTIDWSKTWIWVTDASQATQLKALLAQYLPDDVELECLPHAKDLGYILHYRRRQLRQPQRERHAKAMTTLRKLQRSQYDLHTKALIANTAIIKALYGAHCYVTSEQPLKELRTEISNALVGLHKNVNPYIASSLLSAMVVDPEMYLIQQALRFAREYLLYADDATRQEFLAFAAGKQHRSYTVTGPAGALSLYLAKVGWQLNQQGDLLISAFFSLHICRSTWEDIKTALECSWMEHVALTLSTRKGYKGMPTPDRQATLHMVKNLPDKVLTIATYAITGGYMLQHQKTKFDENQTDDCPYCEGNVDTHLHRVLECPLTDHVRINYPDVCSFFTEHDPLLVQCPILFMEPEWELHRQIWFALPEPDLNLPDFALCAKVYTDGTCQLPEHPTYRFAANAAVCFRPDAPPHDHLLTLTAEAQLDQAFHVISVGLLQGKQTIARAELQIIVRLQEAGHPGPYVTDSQYVINLYRQIGAQPDWRAFHTKPNFDLIHRWHVQYWVHDRRVHLQKVKSHVNPAMHPTQQQQQDQIGNAAADEAAKQAARNLAKPFHTDLRHKCLEQQHHTAMLRQHFSMRFEMALVCIHFDKPEVMVENRGDDTAFLTQMKHWTVPDTAVTYTIDDIPEAVIHASRWGSKFTDILLQWLATLAWPPGDRKNPPVGISWIELI